MLRKFFSRLFQMLFHDFISVINPPELQARNWGEEDSSTGLLKRESVSPEKEENNVNQSFLLNFTTLVRKAYESFAPGIIRFNSINPDAPNNWLIIQFGTTHGRKLDEIGIRWSGDEVTVDFLPGGATTHTLCFKDNYGLRWILLDSSRVNFAISESEKKDIEQIVNRVYAIAQHYKPELRFIIGHSANLATKGEKI